MTISQAMIVLDNETKTDKQSYTPVDTQKGYNLNFT